MDVDESRAEVFRDKFENRSTFIEHIENQMDLLNTFFNNFKHYMLKARASLR